MKAKEFDEIFKPKAEEFCQILGDVARGKGFQVHEIDVQKQRDFTFVFTCFVSKIGVRSLPQRMFYTVMYNPSKDAYVWHEGFPRAPSNLDDRVVN